VAKLALIGHGHQLNAAVAEIGELSKGSIRDVLSKLSTKFVPNDFSDKLELLIKDPKNTEKEFTLDIPITQLYKTPKSREKFIQIIELYIVQPGTKPQDVELLKNILEFIKTDNRVKTTETIKSSTVVRAEIGKAAEKINRTSTGKNAAERLKIAKQDPNMTQLEEKINRATIYNQNAKSEILEQSIEMDAATYEKIFSILGLNPADFPVEKIMSSSALRHEVLNLIGSKDAELEQQLSVSELQKLRSLQSQLVSRVREELLARKEFGTINQYHTDNRRELKNTYPAIASQKEIREAAEVSVT